MLNRPTLVVVILALVAASVVGGIACDVCGGADKAELPVLKIGDEIIFKITELSDEGEEEYQVSYEVTGEEAVNGEDCYLVEAIMDPAPKVEGVELLNVEGTVWIGKATTWSIKRTTTADAEYSGQVYSLVSTEETTYAFAGESYWPLELRKEVEVEKTTTVTSIFGEMEPNVEGPNKETITYKTEGKEEKTVEAGTFDCFVIVKYDEDGEEIATSWYSEEAKVDVYIEDYDEDGEVVKRTELVSYSVS